MALTNPEFERLGRARQEPEELKFLAAALDICEARGLLKGDVNIAAMIGRMVGLYENASTTHQFADQYGKFLDDLSKHEGARAKR